MKMTTQSTILLAVLLQLISAKPCTVIINGNKVDPIHAIPHIENISNPKVTGGISYIEGSATSDTLRYANTGNFPLTTRFTDRYNNEWQVSLNDENSQITMIIPSDWDLRFHGDETDRTGFDKQTEWVQVKLFYDEGNGFPTCNSHGIRVEAEAYSLNNIKENKIDEERWNNVLDEVAKGVDILKSLAEIAAEAPVEE